MKFLICLFLVCISASAEFVQLSHGQTATNYGHQISCVSPVKEANACYVQRLKNKKYGIVLSDNSVIVKDKEWAFISELERLYNEGECSDFFRFTPGKKNIMTAGTRMHFENKTFRCPSSQEITRKNCILKNKGSNFTIITAGGIVLNGGAFETTKIKLTRLMKMSMCNDVTEI